MFFHHHKGNLLYACVYVFFAHEKGNLLYVMCMCVLFPPERELIICNVYMWSLSTRKETCYVFFAHQKGNLLYVMCMCVICPPERKPNICNEYSLPTRKELIVCNEYVCSLSTRKETYYM